MSHIIFWSGPISMFILGWIFSKVTDIELDEFKTILLWIVVLGITMAIEYLVEKITSRNSNVKEEPKPFDEAEEIIESRSSDLECLSKELVGLFKSRKK